ncbi:YceD family protein [Granulicella mallensis]|jgi:uncharacterized protein|uniref:DUF177 domain-containing protein n=1 Tax=Granulicella mallensis (strain ATCC BAA-1857 / DSM 23137 / MP5ACTX8) TaxID=682795 RepID=G8NTD3_GRAMM|nr:DUF177 domain-containing protein [Granulicella mallensis]AEU38645.1 protein of unknown function DUF177 [Granulicella mallensis MP5ACTX8]
MLITPVQLVEEPLKLDESLAAGAIDYAQDVRQIGPLKLQGQAELIVEHRGPKDFVDDIRLRAHFAGTFELLCARCVEPVEQFLSGDFDLIFRPGGVDNQPGEHAITEDETEIGYYEESGLLLEDAVREQVLLALPGRTLCREDCKGLCPQCGANRNTAPCGCEERPVDLRWHALAGIAAPKA